MMAVRRDQRPGDSVRDIGHGFREPRPQIFAFGKSMADQVPGV